ncbi:hypothetical protein WJX77_007779 [Trebouxia sp. C0004]
MAPAWLSMFITSTMPVIQIVLMCCMGALLARQGVLHGQARQHLGQLVFFIFVPCLTFTKLASSVDLNNLAIWWPLPVNTALSILMGLLIGWLTAMVIKPPKELRMHVIVATGLGNVGNLPLVIVATLCDEKTSLFARDLGAQCGQVGIAYVAFSMWVAGFVQYSVAYNMMKLPPKPSALANSPAPAHKPSNQLEAPKTLGEIPGTSESHAQNLAHAGMGEFAHSKSLKRSKSTGQEGEENDLTAEELEMQPLWQQNGHSDSTDVANQVELGRQPSEDMRNMSSGQLESRGSGVQPQTSGLSTSGREANGQQPWQVDPEQRHQQQHSTWAQVKQWTGQGWRRFCMVINLPTASALAGLAVGCASPIKNLLFGEDPPLEFLTESLNIMAAAMIPSMMLVLGSVLHKGPGSAKVPIKIILGVLVVRQILIPFLGTGMVVLAHRWHVFAAPDPLFFMVLLLTHTTPTAINMQTVVTIHQNKEAEMSCLLFWQYMCSVFTLPCFMSWYMHIVQQTTF